jgi:AraC-like DNA-binding protein
MSRQLTQITDWSERAAAARWCCAALAEDCQASLATLERHFQEAMRQCPRLWLHEERMRRARELVERRERIKDIAVLLCYEHQRNFTTAFTKFHGYPPSLHWKKMAADQSRVTKVESRGPKSEIGNRKSEIIAGRESAFDEIKSNLAGCYSNPRQTFRFSNHPAHPFPIQFHQGMLFECGNDFRQMPLKE